MEPLNKTRWKTNGIHVDKGRYQCLVGKLIYLSYTIVDIAFVVSVVSQYMHDPTKENVEAIFRILKYLKGSLGKGLFFKKNHNRLIQGYTNANWAGLVEDRRSTSSYYTLIWVNLVTWRSKKQNVVARSSVKAKFRALAHRVCELI